MSFLLNYILQREMIGALKLCLIHYMSLQMVGHEIFKFKNYERRNF